MVSEFPSAIFAVQLTSIGTVISFLSTPSLRLTAPIALRLKSPDTNLRATGDPSMLLHALLDLGWYHSMHCL